MAKRIGILVVAVVVLGVLLLYSQWRAKPQKISGFIEADEIRLGSRVGGRVQKIFVEEGSRVDAGKVLVDLAPFDLLDQRDQAAAQADSRKADLQKLQAGFRTEEIAQAKARRDELEARLQELIAGPRKETIEAARARVENARAEEAYAQSRYEGYHSALSRGAATKEEIDRATQNLMTARATVRMRQAELAELEAGTRPEDIAVARAQLEQAQQAWLLQKNGSRKEDIAAAQAALDAATAALKAIDTRIAELKIVAPVKGIIEAFDLHPGDLVSPNAPAMSMIDPGKLWVRAFLPEDENVQVGRKVLVTVDSHPGKTFAAHVAFVAQQAEFTPSNVQTPEKRSQQVFRVKVYLDEGLDELRPGMSADVWLNNAVGK
jgi:multidrug resistance efflux pump